MYITLHFVYICMHIYIYIYFKIHIHIVYMCITIVYIYIIIQIERKSIEITERWRRLNIADFVLLTSPRTLAHVEEKSTCQFWFSWRNFSGATQISLKCSVDFFVDMCIYIYIYIHMYTHTLNFIIKLCVHNIYTACNITIDNV